MESSAGALLWLADAAALDAAALERHALWLSESERERLGRFAREERRRQFLVGRALLRRMLGRLLGVAAGEVVLRERPGQAPALDSPAPGAIGFSISHSGPWVACAASLDTDLGLDIECIDAGRDLLAIASHAFGQDQAALLRACEGPARVGEFYRMWCAHEARIKLGQQGAALYRFDHPGLAGALACARPLAAHPQLTLVSLEAA